jgi:hypothetical protein
MQLEFICDMDLYFDQEPLTGDKFMLVRPYGGEEGTGFAVGGGTVKGARLSGKMHWVNHPHRRNDGTMLPNSQGIIVTDDKAVIMISLQGRTVFQEEKGSQLLSVIFEAEAEAYLWLNGTFCVLEGLINADSLQMHAKVYSCHNDLV